MQKFSSVLFPKVGCIHSVCVIFQVKYIAQCIEEIKAELKQENIAVKANAVAKLSYVRLFYLLHC
jgi:hypothetical protein